MEISGDEWESGTQKWVPDLLQIPSYGDQMEEFCAGRFGMETIGVELDLEKMEWR